MNGAVPEYTLNPDVLVGTYLYQYQGS